MQTDNPVPFLPGRRAFLLCLGVGIAAPGLAAAQFVGPGPNDATTTVAAVAQMSVGTYVTVEGNLLSRLNEDVYVFSDATGEMRVEIEPGIFAGRPITPETRVRLRGEIDTGPQGRYLWVEALSLP